MEGIYPSSTIPSEPRPVKCEQKSAQVPAAKSSAPAGTRESGIKTSHPIEWSIFGDDFRNAEGVTFLHPHHSIDDFPILPPVGTVTSDVAMNEALASVVHCVSDAFLPKAIGTLAMSRDRALY
ncbi:hypothetical protein [Streptomyces sp. NPDC013457]|uniref:hypothetical protein n=1 Tax=Streptomyces sp. NPDC013457 TaxID=3364866 RepID=UPI0036F6C0A1